MLATSAIAIFLIAWSAVFLVDYILRVAHFEPYVRFSHRFGVEVSPFQLKFYVTPHSGPEPLIKPDDEKNDPFFEESRRSKLRALLIRLWFSLGVCVSIVCLLSMTVYMSHLLLRDVSQWIHSRPSTVVFRDYRSMHNVLTATPSSTPQMQQQSPPEHNPIIVEPDADYDMIEDGQKSTSRGLVPIIPGFNLPWSHIPVFMAVLVVAAVFHELGHAWAAQAAGVTVNGFGVFIVAVYPGAFTDIEPTTLKRASAFRRLQIFGAGIWHNLLLAGLAMAMFHVAPVMLAPVLVEGRGVSVKGVDMRSGLANPITGLVAGDVITQVDECHVAHVADWWRCIRTARHQNNGRCVDKRAVEAATAFNTRTEADEIMCCDEFNVTTAHVCFSRETTRVHVKGETQTRAPQLNHLLGLAAGAVAEDSPGKNSATTSEKVEIEVKYSCLHARHVVQQAVCNYSNPCSTDEKVCVYPALFNGTRLVKIMVANRNKPILFVGQLNEMLEMVSLSPLSPRVPFASVAWLEHVELAAKYLFTLSLALGLFNAMPVYALDGQFIVQTLLKSSSLSFRRRELVQYVILTFGTAILVLNIVIGFVKLAIN